MRRDGNSVIVKVKFCYKGGGADDFFWTFEQVVSYYKFNMVNYMGFHDKGMILAGGCGDTNGKPQIDKTNHLQEAYEFGKHIYDEILG